MTTRLICIATQTSKSMSARRQARLRSTIWSRSRGRVSTRLARLDKAMPVGYSVPDIRLVQNNVFPKYSVTVDWLLLSNGTLDDTQALATAVIVALGTNALAGPHDDLP